MSIVKSKQKHPPAAKARKSDPINAQYEEKAKSLLRSLMAENRCDYEALAEKLNGMDVKISARGLENKISRGGFSAAFLLQCVDALGAKIVHASR